MARILPAAPARTTLPTAGLHVLLTDRDTPGGIWNVLDPVAEALLARGDRVTCCLWQAGEPTGEARPGEVVRIPVGPGGGPRAKTRQVRRFAARSAAALRTLRPDLVHTNFVLPGAVARRACRSALPSAKQVATQHELYGSMSPVLRLLTRRTLRLADAVTFVSGAVRDSFAGVPLGPGVRGEVLPNGVDFAALDAAVADVRPAGRPGIVCAGRLVAVKGQRALIEALPAVRAAVPGATLTLFGEGPEEPRLRRLAADLGVAGAVTFAGWADRAEVWRRTAAAGCAAVPSDGTQEGFGLVAAEAVARGGPVVASDIPVFREVLAGEPAVRFAPPGDPAAWAAALTDALTRANPEPPADAAAGVRRFSRAAMVDGYLALYDRLLASG